MYRDDPLERIRYIALQIRPGVDLLTVQASSQPWHVYHERFAFCGCSVADADWLYRGREEHSSDGSSMLLEPGETHRNTVVRRRSDFKVVFVPVGVMEEAARELGLHGPPHFQLASTGDPRVFAAIEALSVAVDAGEGALAQESAFAHLMQTVLERSERQPAPTDTRGCREAVNRAKRHLAGHFDQPVSLGELTAITGLSRFHLIRAFARFEGLTPHAFLIHVRIAQALAFLRQGRALTEVASMSGFADQSHFSRHFRNIMRVTPGQYARCSDGRHH